MKKRTTALLSSIFIILSTLTMPVLAENKPIPAKTSDRWAFRQAYVDMPRIENADGTYSFPKLDLTTKAKIYTFIHNLINLEKIADGAGIPGWPAQLTQFTQPMFLELPKDVIGTVGPEDIEIYTVFSNAGSGFKAKLSDEQLNRLYMRENSWINDKDRDVDQYRDGDSYNKISIPKLSRYSAKRFDLTDLALYDENHQVVQPGQKGGAYFKFSIEGALETINPGSDNDPNESPKGYGLRIDSEKTRELTDAILRYINAGMFHHPNSSGNYTQIPNPPFTMEDFNKNLMSAMKPDGSGNGLFFDDFILDVQSADNMISGTAFALATQFMNIDAKALQGMGINSELYGDMGNMQSTWAAAKEGLIYI